MKLSDLKIQLKNVTELRFILPNGKQVPEHFHITEVGQINKNFIDCGGTVRNEKVISMQLWEANDFDHRLAPQKLMNIIAISENILGIEDAEVEVEYQNDTIGKYGLEFREGHFILTAKHTNCLDSDSCGIPSEKRKVPLANLPISNKGGCTPGQGCC
ncbi:MAG TPA: DUF6428 family protein [Cytophagaceae bacterium]|jgi:hypothetical protein|nr:DUF6428 family protein [Cytophagaceae bacterium]